MAGARGCFNCGGCAWCFRRVVPSSIVLVLPSRQNLYRSILLYSFTLAYSLLFILVRAWGADGDGAFYVVPCTPTLGAHNQIYSFTSHSRGRGGRVGGVRARGGGAIVLNINRILGRLF